MKDARPNIRWLVSALIFLLATSFSIKADQKQETSEFLENLHQFRINTFIALDAYYRYSAQADPSIHYEIIGATNVANATVNSLSLSSLGVEGNQSLANLKDELETFKELMRMNVNEVMQSGYSDLRLISEMAEHTGSMNKTAVELRNIALANTGNRVDNRVEAARSAAVTMAQMMASYSVRSNLAVSQTFQGGATEAPLDVKARAFETSLATVSMETGKSPISNELSDISSKWLFIRNSYINYNENNVSFIIDRYSRSIIDSLNSVINILQSNA